MPTHFSTGHLVVAGSDTAQPYGKWCVAMNKLSAGRHINVGPSQPESSQLIDISGEKMKMVAEAYTEPEPHFAQILKVSDVAADGSLSQGRKQGSERGLGESADRRDTERQSGDGESDGDSQPV